MKEVFRRPYIYWFIGIYLAYLTFNIVISQFYYTIPLLFKYASRLDPKVFGSLALSLAIGFFVASNSILVYDKFKERRKCKKEGVVGSLGAVGGMMVGVCPICVGGVFPLFLGFLGITFSFASLPLKGLELQILVLIILLINFKMLTKPAKRKI